MSESHAQFVMGVLRLVRIIRRRKNNVMAAVVVAAGLGTLYYLTAPRVYEARTSLMLTYRGSDDASTGVDTYRQGILPTYERLFYSSVVLNEAANQLGNGAEEDRIDLNGHARDEWIEVLRTNVNARAIRATNFIEVSYRSKDPHAAVTTINHIVASHLDFVEESQRSVAAEFAATLSKGRSDVATELEEKSKQLLQAKSQIRDLGLRNGSDVTHPLVHNVIRINDALANIREDRMRLEANVAAVRQAIQTGSDVRHLMASMEDPGGREMVLSMLGLSPQDETAIQEMEEQLRRDRLRLESIQQHYGEAHPSIVELKSTIRVSEAQLRRYRFEKASRFDSLQNKELGRMLLSAASGKLAKAVAHEASLQQEFTTAQEEAVRLNGNVAQIEIIEHDLRMLRELHDTLRNKIANLDIKQDQPRVSLAVVSDAEPNESPVSPHLILVGVGSLFGGLFAGIAVAYIRELLDDRFGSVDELKEQLEVNVLSVVRRLSPIATVGPDAIQVHIAPNSPESEAFRSLRTTLAFSDEDNDCVAVTSSEPGDGKTTILSNLGVASAQAGKRTLLIDADMRRPGLTKLFETRGLDGLSDILGDEDGDLVDIVTPRILQTGIPGLDMIPSGVAPSDPSARLETARFAKLVDWARGEYDQVIIDTPPILVAGDALIVGRLLNGVVLVVQPSKNNRRLVHRAVDEIRDAGLSPIGVVVNRVIEESYMDYGGGYGYTYGYGEEEPSDHDEPTTDEEAAPNVLPIPTSENAVPLRRAA